MSVTKERNKESIIKAKARIRNSGLDSVRVVAIAAVIMIHVSAGFVTGLESGSQGFFWGNIFDSLSRIGVPLFVMVSGALMLDENKEIPLRKLFFERIPKIIFLLGVWSLVYTLLYRVALPLYKGEPLSIKSIVGGFVFGHYHLWYLYMQIGLYMALPFLRCIVCKKNKNIVLLYIILSLFSKFSIPVINMIAQWQENAIYLVKLINKFKLGFFNEFISYYLIGWYIVHIGVAAKYRRVIAYLVSLLSVVVIIVYVYFSKDYSNAYKNSNILVFLYASGVFLLLNNITINSKAKKPMQMFSEYSFGMYVIHLIVLSAVRIIIPKMALTSYILTVFLTTFFLSFLAAYVLSKIPVLKYSVKM